MSEGEPKRKAAEPEAELHDEKPDVDIPGKHPGPSKETATAAEITDVDGIGEAPDAVFNALWVRVLDAWDEDKPHQAALSYAIEKEMLPEIAGRYRKLESDPAKGPRAKKKMDGIVLAATQMLLATKTPAREKLPWQWTASVAVFMVIVVSFLAYKIFGNR